VKLSSPFESISNSIPSSHHPRRDGRGFSRNLIAPYFHLSLLHFQNASYWYSLMGIEVLRKGNESKRKIIYFVLRGQEHLGIPDNTVYDITKYRSKPYGHHNSKVGHFQQQRLHYAYIHYAKLNANEKQHGTLEWGVCDNHSITYNFDAFNCKRIRSQDV